MLCLCMSMCEWMCVRMLCVCECVCEWLCVNVVCVWASVWVNVCESVMCVCECVCDCVWMCVCERVCEWICVRVLCVWVSVWRCGNEADCGLPWAPCRDGPLHPIFGQSWVSQLGKPWSQGWGKELHPREWRAQGLWHLCHRSKSLSFSECRKVTYIWNIHPSLSKMNFYSCLG